MYIKHSREILVILIQDVCAVLKTRMDCPAANESVNLNNLDEMSNSLQSGSFSSPIGTTSDGRFISLLRTEQLLDMKNEGTKIVGELAVLIEQSKEDDNPILLLCKEK